MKLDIFALLLFLVLDISLLAMLLAIVFFGTKSLLFGIFVPEAYRDSAETAAIRRRFGLMAAAVAVAGIAAAALLADADDQLSWILSAQMIGVLACLWAGRRAARRLKAAQQWQAPQAPQRRVANLKFRKQVKTASYAWYIVHLAVIAACAVCAVVFWDRIPDPVAVHFGADGRPDRYAPKAFGSVFTLNIVQLFLVLLLGGVHQTLRSMRGQLDPAKPEASLAGELKVRRITSHFMVWLSLAVVLALGYGQAVSLYGWSIRASLIGAIAMPVVLLGAIVGMILYMRRQGVDPVSSDTTAQDDALWLLGGIYYNPKDPSLFVRKRYGIGWTVNFGRPLGWVVMIGMLVVPIAIVWIIGSTTA